MWPNDVNGPNENKHLKRSGIKIIECWIQVPDPFPYRERHRMTRI